MAHAFYADAMKRSDRRNRLWYQTKLLRVLQAAKEKQVREIDVSIALAEELMKKLDEPVAKPVVVPMPKLEPTEGNAVMKPIEERVLNILHKAKMKGASERYLKERYKKAPEDNDQRYDEYWTFYELDILRPLDILRIGHSAPKRFLYRVATSWDYGWQQKQARQRARDVNFGRCLILKHTFYRKNNLAPDPPHYAEPAGGQVSICSEYTCTNNP